MRNRNSRDLLQALERLERENAELKRENQALRAQCDVDSELGFTLAVVLDSVEAEIYAADMDTNEILYMNRRMRQRLSPDHVGSTCHETLEGKPEMCSHCVAPKLLDEHGEPAGTVRWECYERDAGVWLVRAATALRSRGGRMIRVQVATDITEYKMAVDNHKHWFGMFENLVKASPNCIIQSDLSGKVEYISPHGARLFSAADASEIIGRPFLDLVAPGDRKRAREILRLALEGRELPYMEREYRLWTIFGQTFYGSVSSAQMQGKNGEPAGVISIIRDITEKKQMESSLIKARDEAEAASRAKSQFLANMSHEIRTPLNGVLGMLQLAMLTELDDEQLEYVETAMASSQSLLKVINDVLDFSKIEAGKLEIRRESFSLQKMLTSVFGVFRNEAEARGLRLIQRVDPGVPAQVVGDEGRLRQILYNLLGNAMKFTQSGEIKVDVSAQSANGRGMSLEFVVADTGVGIPEEKIGSVFESFTQVDGSFTRRHQGTGLGLSIVKRLVTAMGGDISIDSRLGQGATVRFNILLAAERRKDPRELPKEYDALPVDPKLRLLLVEDDHVNRMTTRLFLEKLGYVVAEATNGRDAVEQAVKDTFDCVLMDIQMPEMDGMEAVRRIRESRDGKTRSDVPVVAITAHAMKGDRERFMDSGMDEYVSKPLDLRELVSVLEEVCHR